MKDFTSCTDMTHLKRAVIRRGMLGGYAGFTFVGHGDADNTRTPPIPGDGGLEVSSTYSTDGSVQPITVAQDDAGKYIAALKSEGCDLHKHTPIALHLFACDSGQPYPSYGTWPTVVNPVLWWGYTHSATFGEMLEDADGGKHGW